MIKFSQFMFDIKIYLDLVNWCYVMRIGVIYVEIERLFYLYVNL